MLDFGVDVVILVVYRSYKTDTEHVHVGSPVVEKPSPVIEDLKFTEEEEEIVPDFQRIHISGEDQSGVCQLCVASSFSWLIYIHYRPRQ